MASLSLKLANSLKVLKKLQERKIVAFRTSDISRVHRERLIANGFLLEVMKGWYIASSPNDEEGESTSWYTSFWKFCETYLFERFKDNWCLSPEQSLLLHAENWKVPKQLIVRAPKGNNRITKLPFNTSIFDVRYNMPDESYIVNKKGMRVYTLASALVFCSPKFFNQCPIDIRAVLAMVKDSSEILKVLLEGGHSTIAARLIGAFKNFGNNKIANEISKAMVSAGYDIRESDPFTKSNFTSLIYSIRENSPCVNRIKMLWSQMRMPIIKNFPKPKSTSIRCQTYIKRVEENYVNDAYNSLSIEGYRVSMDLIEKVKYGRWNPDLNQDDMDIKNALAARGYWQAFQKVKKSIQKIFKNKNPGEVARDDHNDWLLELFKPSVIANILKPSDLAGYRSNMVFIRHSMFVPPAPESVRDVMPEFFKLLIKEKDPAVRIVLGHFFFVYIHPYMDGNGRIGRFLMNTMCSAGRYPWIIIPVEKRKKYMSSLEQASVNYNIEPFSNFIASLLTK